MCWTNIQMQKGRRECESNRSEGLLGLGPKPPRNDYDSAIRCTGRLQHTLGEAKNASMERTHTPVRFQVGLSS